MKSTDRILNILSELVENSLDAEASDIQVNIKSTTEYVEITIEDNGQGMDKETVEDIQEILNQPRRRIYDEYYGSLTGLNHSESGLNNVGFQIDDSDIESDKTGTKIRVRREKKTNNI